MSNKNNELKNEINKKLKIIKDCVNCKDKIRKKYSKEFHKLMSKMEKYLSELRKEEQGKKKNHIFDKLINKLNKMDDKLNKKILCESCKEEIEKLTDKCGNKEIARLLYQRKLNAT